MATPSPSPSHLRSVYRSLLRELPPRPLLSSPRTALHARIRDSFAHAPASASSPPSHDSAPRQAQATRLARGAGSVAEAEQLIAYLRAQRVYATLLERYNPGMGMDEEERVRLTARRVGMDLPVEFGGGKE